MQSDNYPIQQYDTNNLTWYSLYQELLEYKKQYGNCNVPSTHENQILFQWVNHQRDDYAKLKMSDEQINMLSAIGFDWTSTKEDNRKLKTRPNNHEKIEALKQNNWTTPAQEKMSYFDSVWNDRFEELKKYKSQHGDCKVPARYDKNQTLAYWVQFQRFQFKHSKLSEERINMLNNIGFNWCLSKASIWNDKFEELKSYKSKHGDCNVSHCKNQPLAYWVHKQRSQFKHSKLSEERIKMLNSIGFNWEGVSNDQLWNDKFEELKQFKSKHGDCNVPQKYDENQPLANWVHTQRSYFTQSKLSEERINMLNTIGFHWRNVSYDKVWNDKFEQLKLYKSKYGDCNVPKKYHENQPLSNWVRHQRSRFKHSKMSEKHKAMLNDIGFNWCISKVSILNDKFEALKANNWTTPAQEKMSVFDIVWNDKFEQLKLYKSKYGDCNVPKKYDKNQPLANWVKTQRFQFKHSKLSEERINILNTVNFNWGVSPDKIWNDKFEQLKLFKSQHGDCNVPAKYDKNQTLAYWVQTQRTYFKHSKISEERINILNTVGFNWGDSTSYQDSKEKEGFAFCNEIDTAQEDSNIERNFDPKHTEITNKEKGEMPTFKRSLQDRVQVLCNISIMFQEQKVAIHADMKRRKLGNSA